MKQLRLVHFAVGIGIFASLPLLSTIIFLLSFFGFVVVLPLGCAFVTFLVLQKNIKIIYQTLRKIAGARSRGSSRNLRRPSSSAVDCSFRTLSSNDVLAIESFANEDFDQVVVSSPPFEVHRSDCGDEQPNAASSYVLRDAGLSAGNETQTEQAGNKEQVLKDEAHNLISDKAFASVNLGGKEETEKLAGTDDRRNSGILEESQTKGGTDGNNVLGGKMGYEDHSEISTEASRVGNDECEEERLHRKVDSVESLTEKTSQTTENIALEDVCEARSDHTGSSLGPSDEGRDELGLGIVEECDKTLNVEYTGDHEKCNPETFSDVGPNLFDGGMFEAGANQSGTSRDGIVEQQRGGIAGQEVEGTLEQQRVGIAGEELEGIVERERVGIERNEVEGIAQLETEEYPDYVEGVAEQEGREDFIARGSGDNDKKKEKLVSFSDEGPNRFGVGMFEAKANQRISWERNADQVQDEQGRIGIGEHEMEKTSEQDTGGFGETGIEGIAQEGSSEITRQEKDCNLKHLEGIVENDGGGIVEQDGVEIGEQAQKGVTEQEKEVIVAEETKFRIVEEQEGEGFSDHDRKEIAELEANLFRQHEQKEAVDPNREEIAEVEDEEEDEEKARPKGQDSSMTLKSSLPQSDATDPGTDMKEDRHQEPIGKGRLSFKENDREGSVVSEESISALPPAEKENFGQNLDISTNLLPHQANAEDIWICKECGWKYPNAKPSAKVRRNHKKHCDGVAFTSGDRVQNFEKGMKVEEDGKLLSRATMLDNSDLKSETSAIERIEDDNNISPVHESVPDDKVSESSILDSNSQRNSACTSTDAGIVETEQGLPSSAEVKLVELNLEGGHRDEDNVQDHKPAPKTISVGNAAFSRSTSGLEEDYVGSESFRSAPDEFGDEEGSSNDDQLDSKTRVQEQLSLLLDLDTMKSIVGDQSTASGDFLLDIEEFSDFLGFDLPARSVDVSELEWARLSLEVMKVVVGLE